MVILNCRTPCTFTSWSLAFYCNSLPLSFIYICIYLLTISTDSGTCTFPMVYKSLFLIISVLKFSPSCLPASSYVLVIRTPYFLEYPFILSGIMPSNKIFCNDGNFSYLCDPILYPLASCCYWALEMWTMQMMGTGLLILINIILNSHQKLEVNIIF